MMKCYRQPQEEVLIRRTRYDLNKVEERVHILEGLFIVLDNIDETIWGIRRARTVQSAKSELIEGMNFPMYRQS